MGSMMKARSIIDINGVVVTAIIIQLTTSGRLGVSDGTSLMWV